MDIYALSKAKRIILFWLSSFFIFLTITLMFQKFEDGEPLGFLSVVLIGVFVFLPLLFVFMAAGNLIKREFEDFTGFWGRLYVSTFVIMIFLLFILFIYFLCVTHTGIFGSIIGVLIFFGLFIMSVLCPFIIED